MASKKRFWFAAEEIPNSHHFMMGFAARAFVQLYPTFGAGNFLSEHATEFREPLSWLLFPVDEFHKSAQYIAKKMLATPQWGLSLGKEVLRQSALFMRHGEAIRRAKLSTLSSSKILTLVERCFPAHERSHGMGHSFSWIVDCYEEYFSGGVRAALEACIKTQGLALDVGPVFSLLSTPLTSSHVEQEEVSFLTIAAAIRKQRKLLERFKKADPKTLKETLPSTHPVLWRAMRRHHWKFTWTEFMYMGPERSFDDFLASWQGYVKLNEDPRVKLRALRLRIPRVRKKQKELLHLLQPNSHLLNLIHLAQLVAWVKPTRKDALFHGHYCYALAFRELARRIGLTMQQFWQFVPWEIRPAVLHGRFDVHELNERRKASVAMVTRWSYRILTGRAYTQWVRDHPRQRQTVQRVDTLAGSCACPGVVRGIVRIVNVPGDMQKMKNGDILVSHSTSPNLLPAMKRAAAIVTDAGGLTSHAAIVSRELNIPCVVGTKVATSVFQDGDHVDVDATSGVVRKL